MDLLPISADDIQVRSCSQKSRKKKVNHEEINLDEDMHARKIGDIYEQLCTATHLGMGYRTEVKRVSEQSPETTFLLILLIVTARQLDVVVAGGLDS